MADSRNTIGSGTPPALRPVTPVRSEAARAAQKAFFEAALGKTAATQPTRAPAQVQAAAPTSATRLASGIFGASAGVRAQTVAATETPPSRLLRPGSIVDIKV
jgi:hypothetical protein